VLAELPVGAGVDAPGASRALIWRRPRWAARLQPEPVGHLLSESHALGLTGRGALSSPARALLTGGTDAAMSAMVTALPAPIDHFLIQADLTVVVPGPLKRELAELQPWRDQAIALKNVNARYETMLGIRPEPPVAMQTARSILDARGPFSKARLIDAGSSKGVKVGNPVINEHGLVGRIVGTSPGISRMLLVTDVASQIPVLVDRTDARAILKGDGSDKHP
jgi:hypothetical protein